MQWAARLAFIMVFEVRGVFFLVSFVFFHVDGGILELTSCLFFSNVFFSASCFGNKGRDRNAAVSGSNCYFPTCYFGTH